MDTILQNFSVSYLMVTLTVLKVIINIIFAGGIARDSGIIHKQGQPIYLVSGLVWAFAALVGGILVVAVYWLVHHTNLTRI